MATAAKKVPLGTTAAPKKAPTPRKSPRVGPLERAAAKAIADAKKAKTLTSPRDQMTAEILRSVAKAADRASAADESREFASLVGRMLELVAVLDPERGGGDDGSGGDDPMDRALAQILGSGPEVRHT